MLPAKDRSRKLMAARRRAALGLGLSAALGIALPGCARMRSYRSAPEPATLGVERPGGEYSSFHAARATSTTAPTDPARVQVATIEPLAPGEMIAAGAEGPAQADLPAEAPTPDASTRLASSTQGVPNASRLLASAERPPAPPEVPAPAPAQAQDPGQLVAEARARLDAAGSYQAAMHRQERIGSTLLPAEDLVVSVRREPLAVRLSWPEGPNQGREAIYRADAGDGKMHVKVPNSPIPRISLAVDNPMVLRNSRYPITEAGFDSILRGLETGLQTPGAVTFAGMETPAPLDRPHPCLVMTKPNGEVARTYLDPDTRLPAVVEVKAPNGDLLEHYIFRDVRFDLPELASADAFDQDARWGPARGLFGRVARGSDKPDETSPR